MVTPTYYCNSCDAEQESKKDLHGARHVGCTQGLGYWMDPAADSVADSAKHEEPSDDESPDHAGLTDAVKLEILQSADRTYKETVKRWASSGAQAPHLIAAFGVGCWVKSRDSQEAELASLRDDRAELQKEVTALAGQVQSLRYWLASGYCDCEDRDVTSSIPDSLERDWHNEVCEYRQRIEIMNGWQEPVEAK